VEQMARDVGRQVQDLLTDAALRKRLNLSTYVVTM
jgi:hypothetical protein